MTEDDLLAVVGLMNSIQAMVRGWQADEDRMKEDQRGVDFSIDFC